MKKRSLTGIHIWDHIKTTNGPVPKVTSQISRPSTDLPTSRTRNDGGSPARSARAFNASMRVLTSA